MCETNKCHKETCPFAFTDASEYAQNTGCLPSPIDIIYMRVVKGKTWACHSDLTKPCIGGVKRLKELGYDFKVTEEMLTVDNYTSEDCLLNDEVGEDFRKDFFKREMGHIKKRMKVDELVNY